MDSTSSPPLETFYPSSALRHPWVQTITAQIQPLRTPAVAQSQEIVTLPDGDALVISRSEPDKTPVGGVILLHGLCGSQESLYIRRVAQYLHSKGLMVIRANMRGAGPGIEYAKQPYHSGRSPDIAALLSYLADKNPELAWVVAGFSLGGNVVLKLAGEYGDSPPSSLRGTIAVCPPIELSDTSKKLASPRNFAIEQYFVALLRKHARTLHRLHGTALPKFPVFMNLRDFDTYYTSVHAEYASVDDYYHHASCARQLEKITISTDIVLAEDDPIVCNDALARWNSHPALRQHRMAHGGHVGFLERVDWFSSRPNWLERAVYALAMRHFENPIGD